MTSTGSTPPLIRAILTNLRHLADEAFHVGILHRLAGLNELQPHTPFCAPGGQCPTPKLWPVVQNNRFRQTSLRHHPIQHPTDAQSAQRGIDFNRRALARAIVHHGQHANDFPRAHAVTHEIHRPPLIRPRRCRAGRRSIPADPSPPPNAHRQSFLPIQSVHPLLIYLNAFAHQHRC
jgi:hypothetical protein